MTFWKYRTLVKCVSCVASQNGVLLLLGVWFLYGSHRKQRVMSCAADSDLPLLTETRVHC